jgi:hypothetical protein
VNNERESLLQKVPSHGLAHEAEADETDGRRHVEIIREALGTCGRAGLWLEACGALGFGLSALATDYRLLTTDY